MNNCKIDELSSRICELGTKSCEVRHSDKEKLIEDIHAKVLGRIASVKGREEARRDIVALINERWPKSFKTVDEDAIDFIKEARKLGKLNITNEDIAVLYGLALSRIFDTFKPEVTGEQLEKTLNLVLDNLLTYNAYNNLDPQVKELIADAILSTSLQAMVKEIKGSE